MELVFKMNFGIIEESDYSFLTDQETNLLTEANGLCKVFFFLKRDNCGSGWVRPGLIRKNNEIVPK